MDSNVSKNTNSHKFFKISSNKEKLTISLRNFVKQWLLLICNLYHQKFQEDSDRPLFDAAITSKIVLVNSQLTNLNLVNHNSQFRSQSVSIPIAYGCPLGLLLNSDEQLPLPTVIQKLEILLRDIQQEFTGKSKLELSLLMTQSGWLNIYLNAPIIAIWLNKLCSQINYELPPAIMFDPLDNSYSHTPQLLAAQYMHSRCCSLLNLGIREKLVDAPINWQQNNGQSQTLSWVTWLTEQKKLWLTESSEYNLLRQLIIVTDNFAEQTTSNWSKIGLNLSQATAIFLADCPFLGEVKQRSPQQAIARLGLIAIVRHWLNRILTEKLNLPAPTEF